MHYKIGVSCIQLKRVLYYYCCNDTTI